MIFLARTLSAAILFFFLGKANVWLTPQANTTLAFGYRVFLLLSPFLVALGGKNATALSFLIGSAGVGLWMSGLGLAGAVCVALGLSCGGYLIKSQAAETAHGAALNKISLNIGSLSSGLLIALPFFQLKDAAYSVALFTLLVCVGLSIQSARNREVQPAIVAAGRSLFLAGGVLPSLRWGLIGTAIGIKMFGIFSVLPQYLMREGGFLPPWYGALISLNSLLVIVLQLPIMRAIQSISSSKVIVILFGGLVVLGSPQIFSVDHVIGATIWVTLLSLAECCVSRLDVDASSQQSLLPKEASVGLGAAVSVICMRSLSADVGPALLATVGGSALFLAYLMRIREPVRIRVTSSSVT